jgi:hypothetical protein
VVVRWVRGLRPSLRLLFSVAFGEGIALLVGVTLWQPVTKKMLAQMGASSSPTQEVILSPGWTLGALGLVAALTVAGVRLHARRRLPLALLLLAAVIGLVALGALVYAQWLPTFEIAGSTTAS